ncbi:MAG: class I SAM-dependent methyltransferase [Verrucomicrobia bacterium]|nr:class I SAM-dependent methyltransferase [Verrucomicrobiota bacterium]
MFDASTPNSTLFRITAIVMEAIRKQLRRIKRTLLRQLPKAGFFPHLTRVKRACQLEFRKFREAKNLAFPLAGYSRVRFYQFTKATAEFFFDRVGRTDIYVPDTPHFHLARALVGGSDQEIEAATTLYTDYLVAASETTGSMPREPGVAKFKRCLFDAQKRPQRTSPVILTQLAPGGEYFTVDGNARLAMALALGREIRVKVWPFDLAFMNFAPVTEFYGTQHNNRPYQSILFRQKIAIPGRREDTIERLRMIPGDLLSGARVLDIASNFGMTSILARSLGAASVLGLELSSNMVDLASRFAMLEGVHPEVQFRRFNIVTDALGEEERFDIGFMFSIFTHLSDPQKLTRITERHIRKYVVFESHPGGKYETYKNFFDSGLFESVKEVGRLSRSVFMPEKTRVLWLCKKAHFA